MKRLSLLSLLFMVALLNGCAHKISITPFIENLPIENDIKINKNVGYYLSPANRAKHVITPGGGGDDVEYTPYNDLESALQKVLINIYKDVTKLTSKDHTAEIKNHDISYVFIPEIVTNSSSESMFTWPPTDFSIEITMKVMDKDGIQIWQGVSSGKGHAEYEEFKSDFSLSARHASEKVFVNLQKLMQSSKKIR